MLAHNPKLLSRKGAAAGLKARISRHLRRDGAPVSPSAGFVMPEIFYLRTSAGGSNDIYAATP